MDSDSSIEARATGQPTVSTGTATSDFGFDGTKAEFAPADDVCSPRSRARHRGAHHPPALGDGHPA